jgi:hypothetical protein
MPYESSFTLVDDYGRTLTKRYVSTAATAAEAEADAAAFVSLIEGVSDMAVLKRQTALITPVGNEADGGANRDTGATVHVRLNNSKLYPVKIPGVDLGIVNEDGSLNLASPDLLAFLASFDATGEYLLSETNWMVGIEYGELDK